jgi:hypothetical protein
MMPQHLSIHGTYDVTNRIIPHTNNANGDLEGTSRYYVVKDFLHLIIN